MGIWKKRFTCNNSKGLWFPVKRRKCTGWWRPCMDWNKYLGLGVLALVDGPKGPTGWARPASALALAMWILIFRTTKFQKTTEQPQNLNTLHLRIYTHLTCTWLKEWRVGGQLQLLHYPSASSTAHDLLRTVASWPIYTGDISQYFSIANYTTT